MQQDTQDIQNTQDRDVNSPFEFKRKFTFHERVAEAKKIRAKYPERVPIICEIAEKHRDTLKLDKHKYLVPNDLTVGGFMHVIRKRIKLDPSQAMFIFINNNLVPGGKLIKEVYKQHAESDQFVYVLVSLETTFGAKY